MKSVFVRTTNVRDYLGAFDKLEERGTPEVNWVSVSGAPGLGKTRAMMWHAAQLDAPYLRANPNWTVSWMLEEMAGEYGLETTGSTKNIYAHLLGRMATIGKPFFMDEARGLLHNDKLLETLRTLTDVSECPLVLGGEDTVLKRITTKYKQVRRRILETVEFKTLSRADMDLIFAECCEVSVTPEVIAEALRQCSGFTAEAKNAVAAVERLARLQGVDLVELGHVAGKRLCQDRNEIRARPVV